LRILLCSHRDAPAKGKLLVTADKAWSPPVGRRAVRSGDRSVERAGRWPRPSVAPSKSEVRPIKAKINDRADAEPRSKSPPSSNNSAPAKRLRLSPAGDLGTQNGPR